ncbi:MULTISPECIES: hypothetical protein [Glutamicibacter]|uniref:Integral membrane protein n=1 Tax=Glutamicibacter nicotianae TaxID=37929 RepID=A0ABQ0RL63_GLUNI|nr:MULTISPECIES: hypothetical protein [Glutamicibacter]MDV2978710.1 hypothetical protein [Actinomycetes bacterium ARC8]WIV45006.1 hypothetical protein QQS42_05215 [Glutamicibacter nicotianae]GEC12571.1 hypothetical protein ANI01nite_17740 [Glutamicibacter nicotianae]
MGEKQRNSRIMQAAEARSANKAPKPSRSTGLGRVIIAVYGILALAATVRAVYQIMSKFDEAPIAYSLSLVSGLIYILATFSLSSAKRGAWLVSLYAVAIELVGVIVVGILSLTHPEEFAHPSVWSGFGEGYGYVPLVLPLIGLWWLYRNRNERHV